MSLSQAQINRVAWHQVHDTLCIISLSISVLYLLTPASTFTHGPAPINMQCLNLQSAS